MEGEGQGDLIEFLVEFVLTRNLGFVLFFFLFSFFCFLFS